MSLVLYQHQKDLQALDPKKTGIFWGTGGSKTISTLLLAEGKTLVVCPKILRDDKTWERNLEKLGKKLDITVVSKEDIRRDWEKYPHYDTVIVDETHTVASVSPSIVYRKKIAYPKTSQMFDAVNGYIKKHNPSRLYLLTATPTRSPFSVFAMATLLGKTWDFYQFRNIYYVPIKMGNREIWMPKKDNITKERLAKTVRSLGVVGQLSDWFDVPMQSYKTVYVGLTDKQKMRLQQIPLEYPEPIVQCGKRHQIENGVLTGDRFNSAEYFDNEKIDKILDYALEFPKMVVFSKYLAQIEMIATALQKEGYKVLTLTGATKDRESVLQEANSSSECIIIISAQISEGYELPDFPVMVFASMTYSIVSRIQAEGRILRASNLKKNLYITLVTRDKADTVDEAVYKCIELKKDFSEAVYCNI